MHTELSEHLEKDDKLHFEGIIKVNILLGSCFFRPGGQERDVSWD